MNAPALFQRLMQCDFADLMTEEKWFVAVYLDDVLIFSPTLEDHKVHLSKVLDRLREVASSSTQVNAILYVDQSTTWDTLLHLMSYNQHQVTYQPYKSSQYLRISKHCDSFQVWLPSIEDLFQTLQG